MTIAEMFALLCIGQWDVGTACVCVCQHRRSEYCMNWSLHGFMSDSADFKRVSLTAHQVFVLPLLLALMAATYEIDTTFRLYSVCKRNL